MKSVAVFALAALQCWVVRAQEGFVVPGANLKDFDSSFTVVQGEVVECAWVANSSYQPTIDGEPIMADDSKASLWLTSFDGGDNRFGKLLTPSVISAGRASWGYEVDLTDDEIDRWKGKFNYRLMKPVMSPSAAFVDSRNTIISRGFIIRKKSDVAASLASVSASYSRAAASSQSSAMTLTTQTTPAASSASPTAAGTGGSATTGASAGAATGEATSSNETSKNSSANGGLSTGAKAGIAVGCVAFVIIGALAGFLPIRRRHRASNIQTTPELYSPHFTEKPAEQYQSAAYRHEAPTGGQQAYEMPAQQEHEYKAELMGSQGKPAGKP